MIQGTLLDKLTQEKAAYVSALANDLTENYELDSQTSLYLKPSTSQNFLANTIPRSLNRY